MGKFSTPTPEQEAYGRKMRGFKKLRYAQVAEARMATPRHEPELFDADKHLPPMPKGYARYRESSEWIRHEADIRSTKSSICDDCQRHTRCDLFHTSARRIIPHDPTAIVMLCPTCYTKRIPLKPAAVKIKPTHQKNNIRETIGLPNFQLPNTE